MAILSYGAGSPEATNLAFQNFVRPGMDVRSLSCTPIELLSKDGKEEVLGTATGFFWLHQGRPHLVTNWHVVSGRDPFTSEVMSKEQYVPSQFNFYAPALKLEGEKVIIERRRLRVTLGAEVEGILETPPTILGGPVDLWAMQLPAGIVFGKDPTRTGFVGAELTTCFINEANERRILTQAGDDCFLLGYPLRNYSGGMFPIWKRGSIASDTNIGVDGRPIFLVDAATTAGMSGSPIVRRTTTLTGLNQDLDAIQEMHAFEFIGVYAGRLLNTELAATNIGYAWYRSLIPAVVQQFEKALVAQVSAAASG
jgi:hypothetical protein